MQCLEELKMQKAIGANVQIKIQQLKLQAKKLRKNLDQKVKSHDTLYIHPIS
jgi:hypothetical protein